jgi:hypothetical protein
MNRLQKIGIVLVSVIALAGVGTGLVAAQSGDDSTPTPSATEEPAASPTEASDTPDTDATAVPDAEEDSTEVPKDGATDPSAPSEEDGAEKDGRLCPKEQREAEETSETSTAA